MNQYNGDLYFEEKKQTLHQAHLTFSRLGSFHPWRCNLPARFPVFQFSSFLVFQATSFFLIYLRVHIVPEFPMRLVFFSNNSLYTHGMPVCCFFLKSRYTPRTSRIVLFFCIFKARAIAEDQASMPGTRHLLDQASMILKTKLAAVTA